MRVIRKRSYASLAIMALAYALLIGLSASEARAQDDANTFSKNVPEQTITFSTVNPYTKVSGSMTIVFSGVFHATRPAELTRLETPHITGGQRGTFTFVPDDPSQPTISGRFRFSLAGKPQPHSDVINFAFMMEGTAPDGSMVAFVQTERAVVSEADLDISFGKTEPVAVRPEN